MTDNEDFSQYRKLIIKQLEHNEQALEEQQRELSRLHTAIAVQNAKAAVIATVISVLVGVAGVVMKLLQ